MSSLWGIDLGGTKVEGAILKSASDTQVLFRDRLPTEGHQGYGSSAHRRPSGLRAHSGANQKSGRKDGGFTGI